MSDLNIGTQLLELTGSVKNIIFRNEKNGYTVLELSIVDGSVVAVGTMPLVNVGEDLRLIGLWKNHASFGTQFAVQTFERSLPSTSKSILKYLSSGAIKGVGKTLAQKLVSEFGDKTLEIIENDPDKLSLVNGVSRSRAQKISEEFKKIFGLKELMAYLEKFSITPEESIKIWQVFGTHSLEAIKNDPYIICADPILVSFDNADVISQSLSFPNDDECRISAGIMYILNHNMKNGHTCLPVDKLTDAAAKFLEVDYEKVTNVLNKMSDSSQLIVERFGEKYFAFTKPVHHAEKYSASRMIMMTQFPVKVINGIEKEIALIEKEQSISYATLQKKAIIEALSKGVLILTGGPGTGKTTTLNAIIKILSKKGEKVLLAAPTGRAAQRMSQVTGLEAKTIHRLLEVEWNEEDHLMFRRNEKNLLKCDALVLDEVSMIDVNLFECVLKAVPLGCRLIMVGDKDQLPSVGAGNILGDLIKSDIFPVVQLTEIFRQSMKSLIVTNAHKIVRGELPELNTRSSDFFFLNVFSMQEVLDTIIDLYTRRLPKSYSYSPISDIQVLCPGKKGILGTININTHLQEKINPPSINRNELKIGSVTLREGDKVIQVKNNYNIQFIRDNGDVGEGIFNGDIGTLLKINKKKSTITVKFDDKTATYPIESATDLDLAYALTVHKSQGNEFEAVIMPMICHSLKLAYRNLLYTAVTRAKSLLILVGTKNSVEQMVNNDKKTKRYSGLYNFLISKNCSL